MPRRADRLLLVVFFLSGASGLAYEVVWTRLLGLAVGHTTVALTAVVAAFMGGLAGGSAWFGRRLARDADPVRMYIGLELGIAALALLFPLQVSIVAPLSAHAARVFDSGGVALGVVRFCVAALAVVPATWLMGGTMPAMLATMSGAARRDEGVAFQAGVLYAVNTAGAVAGAALAGFVLIERVGTLETTWLAAAANVVAALVALVVMRGRLAVATDSRTTGRSAAAERRVVTGAGASGAADAGAGAAAGADRAVPSPWPMRIVLASYAAAGFASLALQVVWTRTLVFFAGSTTYAFSSLLIVFLTGIAAGSALGAPLARRWRRPALVYAIIQVAVGFGAAASVRALRAASPFIDAEWPPDATWMSLVIGHFLKALVTTGLPTLLMGAAFPLAVRLVREAAGAPPRVTAGESGGAAGALLGRLYAANTGGAIGGAAVAGLVLLPLFGVGRTLAAAAIVSVAAGVAMLAVQGATRALAAGVGVAAAGLLLATADRTALHVPVGSERLVFYEEGMSGTVSVLEEVTGTRTIYIDRVPVAGTDAIMLTDQKSLAHVPMLLNPSARRVLTVGFGSGGASWSFTRYPSLERVDAVEIDPSVFHAAPHLRDSNHGVWEDPRFSLVLEDARHYLASTDVRYDVIATDCTDLRYKSNANLYTVDYFRLLRDRLSPGGLATVWMPLGGLGGDTFRMALRTFRAVFPHSTVWYMTNQPTHYLLLVGGDAPLRPDLDAITRGVAQRDVRADLAEIRLDDPLKLSASLLLDEEGTARLAGEGPVNTDRHPLLEFQAPRLAYRDALATNLRGALAADAATPVAARAQRFAGDARRREALRPYLAATPPLVEGHARYQLGTFDYAGALRLYRSAAAINPADTSIPRLITDVERTRDVWLREFEQRTRGGSTDVRDWLAYASVLRQVGRTADALAANERAVVLGGASTESLVRLAATQAAAGAADAALATLERARVQTPDDPVVLSDLGAAYNERERFGEAAEVLRRSLAIAPGSEAYNNLGVALNGLEQPAAAAEAFRAALSANPALPDAWFNLGVSHAMQRDWNAAREAYERGLAVAPGDTRALQNLAMIEAGSGRLTQAVERLREAVARDPRAPELRNDLGRAYLALGEHTLAIRELEEALALDPGSTAIAANLALARGTGAPATATPQRAGDPPNAPARGR